MDVIPIEIKNTNPNAIVRIFPIGSFFTVRSDRTGNKTITIALDA